MYSLPLLMMTMFIYVSLLHHVHITTFTWFLFVINRLKMCRPQNNIMISLTIFCHFNRRLENNEHQEKWWKYLQFIQRADRSTVTPFCSKMADWQAVQGFPWVFNRQPGFSRSFCVFTQWLRVHIRPKSVTKSAEKGGDNPAISWYMIGQNRPRDDSLHTHSY